MSINTPKNTSLKKIYKYFQKLGLGLIAEESKRAGDLKKDLRFEKQTYKPDILHLYRLHQFILLNKRLNVLEYGTGWSTLVIFNALIINKKKYKNLDFLRIKKPFSLNVVDDNKKFINISKKRVKKIYKNNDVKFHYCKNKMSFYKKKYCSEYVNHPTINPDLIYLDGPDQFKIQGRSNNFTISNYEMMPMNSDILKYEHFLNPGTIILTDGRTANARFLKANFQRKWKYKFDEKNDQSLFYLNEKPLGRFNKKQMNFYKSR